jgi:uncharacterized protein involved in response to NO
MSLPLQEPAPEPAKRWALWDLGFRPFYLLAAALAVLSVPLWILQLSGWLERPLLMGPAWHAHEMLFGFALAVIIGFLFTAGRNWSGQATPTGKRLMLLAALWLLARILVLTPWAWASLLANLALPWLAAWYLWRALSRAGNRRNYFFVALLLALGGASAVVHLNQLGALPLPAGLGLPLALDLVLFMVVVMSGRVVPMFSNNGVPGLQAQRDPAVERVALASILALALCDALGLGGRPAAAVLLVGLAAHARRWWLWQPWGTRRAPLVWVLHAAYLWLLVHLALRVGAELGWIPGGPATHALTVGLLGMVILGMMTRTALGHTGRPLRAGRLEICAYLAVLLAAVVRVFMPLLAPATLLLSAQLAAALWSLAFALYLWRYTPFLLYPRQDGKPG